ncbi:NifB/NifX family molybdenum-iron cluster-binding protein [Bacteroidota bacterium]
MKLCIPVKENNGLDSEVYSHFGSASAFIIYDTDKQEFVLSNNADKQHMHGQCQPMNSLVGQNVDVVIVGGIGERAILKLNAMDIKVYKSEGGTVRNNIELFHKSSLMELTPEYACTHHGQGNGCE